jgi:drug/metabolite transporter (DMT)-like permease
MMSSWTRYEHSSSSSYKNQVETVTIALLPGSKNVSKRTTGIHAALSSALFLGLAPVFGKQAINMGLPWLGVVALRTALAALLLLVLMLVFRRKYLYIYPAGLLGCLLAGGINGFGSLLYYGALGRIDASVGQLLYALYPLFVALWLRLDHQPLSRLSLVRLTLSVPAVYLLTRTANNGLDGIGMLMMLAAAALYALHLPINQRVLFDMPAPTVTLYTLVSMSIVVVPAYLLFFFLDPAGMALTPAASTAWLAVGALTLVTFLSRLMLFLGVKHLGGMQTALLGLGELLITLVFAYFLLAERFSASQWMGALLLLSSLALVALEKTPTRKKSAGGWLGWLRPPIPADLTWQPDQIARQGD